MIQKLRQWLVRARDQTAVTYNRFGRPGDEEEDKPTPTTIYVAPFNENAPEFMLFGVCHVTKAAVYFACFGMAMCILSFITTFFEFDWYHQKRGVDIGALLGLFLYLAGGVLTHYYVIYGVKRQLSRYLLPYIAVYSVFCTAELVMCIALLVRILDPSGSTHIHVQVDKHGTATVPVEVKSPPLALGLFGILFVLCVQGMMLAAVLRCRHFLSKKQEHEIAMKVAEKSKQEFPNLQIVMANQNGAALSNSLNSFAPPASPPNDPEIGSESAAGNPIGGQQGILRNGNNPSLIPKLI